jgi:hypothetical protein
MLMESLVQPWQISPASSATVKEKFNSFHAVNEISRRFGTSATSSVNNFVSRKIICGVVSRYTKVTAIIIPTQKRNKAYLLNKT